MQKRVHQHKGFKIKNIIQEIIEEKWYTFMTYDILVFV